MSLNSETVRPGGVGALTPREQQVLALMAQGLSNLAVSRRLSLTRKTVDCHIRSIFAKLGLPPSAESHRRVLAVLVYMGDRARQGWPAHPTTSARPYVMSSPAVPALRPPAG